MLAAYYYPATKRQPAILDIVRITANGQNENIKTIAETKMTKREARGLAECFGAKPWNF
jgi:hypothetical protein